MTDTSSSNGEPSAIPSPPATAPEATLPPEPAPAPAAGASRSVGFRNAPAAAPSGDNLPSGAAPPSAVAPTANAVGLPSQPTPLPKRPKGRAFVGFLVLAVVAALGYTIWDSFWRYQAYGAVVGRVIETASPQNGIIQSLHVREGQHVRQGELLVTLSNLDLNQRLERLGDDLQIAQAELDAEMTELKWQARLFNDRNQRTLAEYYEQSGVLLQEQAKLADLQWKLKRRLDANKEVPGAHSKEEVDSLQFAEGGQRAKVEKLKIAVEELKKLSRLEQQEKTPGQLQPKLARIESLQAEIKRLRDQIKQGQIRAPANGRVIKLHGFTGEYAEAGALLVEILEEGSLEALIYMPQRYADQVAPGDELELQVDPLDRKVPVRIERFGERLEVVPTHLQRYYRRNESLLVIHTRPQEEFSQSDDLRLGSEIKLPHPVTESWRRRLASLGAGQTKETAQP